MKHLEPFYEYVNKSGRGASLSHEEFLKLLNDNCKQWLENPIMLTRFKKGSSDKYSYINPKKYRRRSIGKYDYNTMLMNNLPEWRKFPKRSKSVIFTYKPESNRGAFGSDLFFVIPYDNAKIAVSPGMDLWASRNVYSDEVGFDEDLSRDFGKAKAPSNYREFKKWFNYCFNVDKDDEFESRIAEYGGSVGNIIRRLFILYKTKFEKMKPLEFLEKVLAPKNFRDVTSSVEGYSVIGYNQLESLEYSEYGNECWTDSECLVYYAENGIYHKNIMQDYFNIMLSHII